MMKSVFFSYAQQRILNIDDDEIGFFCSCGQQRIINNDSDEICFFPTHSRGCKITMMKSVFFSPVTAEDAK